MAPACSRPGGLPSTATCRVRGTFPATPAATRVLVALAAASAITIIAAQPPARDPGVELVVDAGHGDAVTELAFSSDEQLLFSASNDGTVRIWRVSDGRMLRSLSAHSGRVTAMAVCPSAPVLVTAGSDRAVRVWSTRTGALLHAEIFTDVPMSAGCSSTGQLAAVSEGLVTDVRWGTAQARAWRRDRLPDSDEVHSFAFSSSGTLFAAEDDRVTPYHLGARLVPQNPFRLRSAPDNLSIAGNYLLASSLSSLEVVRLSPTLGSILVRDVESDDVVHLGARPPSLAILRDGTLEVTDLLTRRPTRTRVPEGVYTSIELGLSGASAAAGLVTGEIRILDRRSGSLRARIESAGIEISDVQIERTGLRAVASAPTYVRSWALGTEEEVSTFAGNLLAAEGRWLGDIGMLVAKSPLTVHGWNVNDPGKTRNLETSAIYSRPFACTPRGRCAWQEERGKTHELAVHEFEGADTPLAVSLGDDDALDLDLTVDGRLIAVAVNRAVIRLIDTATRGVRELRLLAKDAVVPTADVQMIWPRLQRLIRPANGMALAVKFSPDGRFLAAANDSGIHLWTTTDLAAAPLIVPGEAQVLALGWSSDNRLFAADASGLLRMWTPGQRSPVDEIGRLDQLPRRIAVSSDGALVASVLPHSQIDVWSVAARRRVLSLALASNGSWIAATPDGRFDAAEDGWRSASWRFGGVTTDVRPLEQYFKDFFYAGLVDEVLRGVYQPVDSGPPEKLNRRAPQVSLRVVRTVPASAQLVPGEGIVRLPERVTFAIDARGALPTREVLGLALTVNGIVAYRWGDDRRRVGAVSQEVEVELPPGEVRVTAYAFNDDEIRSAEAVWERPMRGSGYATPPSTLHVLAIAAGDYPSPQMKLRYPSNDAQLIQETIRQAHDGWPGTAPSLADPATALAPDALFSPGPSYTVPSNLDVQMLVDVDATRAGILQALTSLVARARPSDSVIIYYSGHGVADESHFYFVPIDGTLERPDATPSEIGRAAPSLLSDDEIAQALLPLYVSNGALVVDACQSGWLAAGAAQRGPRRLPGLGRLAYEKGLHLLTAAEADQVSYELRGLRHGVLTYALFHEGLGEGRADALTPDGRLELGEWLMYGSKRAAELTRTLVPGLPGAAPHPLYVPRRKLSPTLLVIGSGRAAR